MSVSNVLQRMLLCVAVLLPVAPVLAQGGIDLPLPKASDYYGDDDPAAVPPKAIDPTDNRAVKTLEQILQYDPENVNARMQNAELLIARGMRQRGLDEYAYALRLAGSNEKQLRAVHWNYGWALFHLGEPRGAISQWMQAQALHGGLPQWAPTTYAIGLWAADEKALALEFYRSAVRSNPRRWGEASGLKETTRNWTAAQKEAIETVYAEWRKNVGAR
jgi:Tfp pilus assembly protein PilF